MQAKLVIVGGKANKREISLELPSTIGRSREADLTVAHPMISRQHCELFEVDGQVMIRDLDSLNGTFVAQQQVKEAALRPHDRFSIGPLTFQIEYDYLGATPVAPLGDPAVDTGQPEAESAAATPSTKPIELEPPADGPVVAPGIEETLAVDPEPVFSPLDGADQPGQQPAAIAPADGELPDFTAWAAADSGWQEPQAPPVANLPVPEANQPDDEVQIEEEDEDEEEPEPEPSPPPIRQETPVHDEPAEIVEVVEIVELEEVEEAKQTGGPKEIEELEEIGEIEEIKEEAEQPEPTPSEPPQRPAPVGPKPAAKPKQARPKPAEPAESMKPAAAEEPDVELEPAEPSKPSKPAEPAKPAESGEPPIGPPSTEPAVSSDDDELNEFLKGLQ